MRRTSLIVVLLVLLVAGGALAAPKNIILLIGDGMGLAHVAGARIASQGLGGRLAIDSLPVTGIVTTYSANAMITDSAAAATALSTGVKTNNGVVGQSPDGQRLKVLCERAYDALKVTGLVTTTPITDATPACMASHVGHRSMQADIAAQLLDARVNVLLGGGKSFFIPKSIDGSGRSDERDLITDAKSAGYDFVDTTEGLAAAHGSKLLGLFELGELTTKSPEPPLSDLASKAIDVLCKDKHGFFLMVEGGLIDHRAHANDFDGMVTQLLEFDKAVAKALAFAKKDGNTLVVVVADHETGGLTLLTDDKGKLKPTWSTSGHTGSPVPIYAYGPGSDRFAGFMDNTDVSKKIAELLMSKSEKAPVKNVEVPAGR
jgi:alkaline phosphatase